MEKRKVLIVSCTSFYGGAEIFINRIFPRLVGSYKFFYQVRNKELYDKLPSEDKYLINEDVSFMQEISFAKELIFREKIDIVILNGNRAIYMAPFLPTKVCKIAYKHSSVASTAFYKKGIYYILITLGLAYCHKVVGVSRTVINEIKGFAKKKVLIYNGVYIPKCLERVQHPERRITYVGRLEKEKGILEALSVVEQLSSTNQIIFNIAGNGVLFENIKAKIAERKWNNIHLLGSIDHVDELLVNSDIFILPSYYEAISLSILEAMAYGLPVLATRTGGIPEAVDEGVTGILVPPKDIKALKQGLEKLLTNSSECYLMGKAGRARAQELFNIEKTIESIDKLLKDIAL